MGDFTFYFRWGTDHILTWDAMDHILFIIALCIRYTLPEWKKVVILVTAFTIGHSLTLALTALRMINLPTNWIEFFIPLTIGITAYSNLRIKKEEKPRQLPVIYLLALFFGLIHGMAFAGQFMALEGREGLVKHLLAFNLGIEAAQLLIVAAVLMLPFILSKLVSAAFFNNLLAKLFKQDALRLARLIWIKAVSAIILVTSLVWAIQRFPINKKEHNAKTTVPVSHRNDV
jgi:hydrogenase/urease accessory protein HupE